MKYEPIYFLCNLRGMTQCGRSQSERNGFQRYHILNFNLIVFYHFIKYVLAGPNWAMFNSQYYHPDHNSRIVLFRQFNSTLL